MPPFGCLFRAGAFRCLYTLRSLAYSLAWHVQHLPPAQAAAVLRQRGWLHGIRDMANGLDSSFSIAVLGSMDLGVGLYELPIVLSSVR